MINQTYVGLTQTVANCLVISWADAHADIVKTLQGLGMLDMSVEL